jgi:ribosomal protein S18 acetylase RimI-like enzyme
MTMASADVAGFSIRAPTRAELLTCAEIFAAGQREILPETAKLQSADRFAKAVDGERIIVAVATDGVVAGFLSLWLPDRFVHFLHVHADCRGRGVGRMLLEHARRQVSAPLELKCLLSNTRALAFYRHLGWREVERDKTPSLPFIRLRQPH